jgi:catechol 2,3-dioxygenase-like lactoylglutathione lyase family enzyme
MKTLFEVVILPVSDADRSLRFYGDQLGFELDVDYAPSPDFRDPDGNAWVLQERGYHPT